MKGAIETMIATVIVAFMVVVSTSYIMVSLNVMKAQKFHSQVIAGIEASDFSPTVISNLKEDAVANGYDGLEIEVSNSVDGNAYAKVKLDYNYSIPVLGIDMEYDLVGYAR